MTERTPAWYDEQYNNRGRIPEHPAILQRWADTSAAALAALGPLELAYGDDATERLDLFAPAAGASGAASAPVLIYFHGGYWRALGKRDQSFVAPPFADAGTLVVLPDYALCPAVSIEHIIGQMQRAVAWVYRHASAYGGDPARIVVAGHSAGGHLAAMMLASDWPQVAPDLPAGLVRTALAISGVFDLEPLRRAPFLAPDLRLDAGTARRLSPASLTAPAGRLAAVVGANESEEFLRQNELIRKVWGPSVVEVCEALPGHHHMSIIGDLGHAGSRLHAICRRCLGLEG